MENRDDDFSLHSAAKSNDLETAGLILSERIDICCKDKVGLTAFDILIQKKIESFDTLHEKEKELSYSIIRPRNEETMDEGTLHYIRKMNQEYQEKFEKEEKCLLNAIYKNDRFIDMLLKYKSIDDSCTNDTILQKLNAACTIKDSSIADSLSNQVGDIEQSIRKDSPIYPGYTALHFAAYCNINTVKMLVTKGANLLTQDAEGVTPLDICTKWFSLEEMQSTLNLVPEWKSILFSDGKTKLMDYISSLCNVSDHKILLQNMDKDVVATLSKNSPLWPGYTILHVAVSLIIENIEIVKDILKLNINTVTIQDCHGSTPVHLAFRYNQLRIINLLLKDHKKAVNPLDKDNLSHLHIAAAVNRQPLVKNILKSERNCNVAYKGKPLSTVKSGWTPLHTAAYTNHAIVAKLLLEYGANLLQTDSDGFTAVHLLVNPNSTMKMADILFSSNQLKECKVEGIGLTHLHVAVWKNDINTIERLINSGADLEAAIIGKVEIKNLKKFEGFRPIHMAMMDHNRVSAFAVLLKRGADIFEKKFNGPSPLEELLSGKYDEILLKPILQFFWTNEKLQNRIKQTFGITMLHVACYMFDKKRVQELLEKNVDVNARTLDDSTIWPGCTPLHILFIAGLSLKHDRMSQLKVDTLLDILLKQEADVTLTNAAGDTPVIMALKIRHTIIGRIRAHLLLRHQRNFSVNPTNESGMSHFHVVCLLCQIKTAEEFFKNINHLDVNQAIINTSGNSKFAGSTPLLLALTKRSYDPVSQVKMVTLLLERGADVHAVDAFGYTPLHKLCSCTSTRKNLLDKILIDNTDINKRAVDGKTPMEILLRDGASSKEVEYFVERGAVINNYNPVSDIGYMAIVVNNDKFKNSAHPADIIKKMINSSDIGIVSDTGRNAIHNAVAAEDLYCNYLYSNLIDQLIKLGCNIFQQDSLGRTALHLAVKFQNEQAVSGLLYCGADFNIVDSKGKSPFSYAAEFRKDKRHWVSLDSNAPVCKILAVHIKKLQLIGLQVSKQNADLLETVLSQRKDIDVKFFENVMQRRLEDAAKIKICERGFTVRDFLCQTGVVNSYASLKQVDRNAVDSFFEPLHFSVLINSFLNCSLKLQYRYAVERSSLIVPAVDGLRRLLSFPLPDLCADIVLMYLTNLDIKNMITATIIFDADCTRMAVD